MHSRSRSYLRLHTFPNACKAFAAYMQEGGKFIRGFGAAAGLSVAVLPHTNKNPMWTAAPDPKKHAVPRRGQAHADAGGLGTLGAE